MCETPRKAGYLHFNERRIGSKNLVSWLNNKGFALQMKKTTQTNLFNNKIVVGKLNFTRIRNVQIVHHPLL